MPGGSPPRPRRGPGSPEAGPGCVQPPLTSGLTCTPLGADADLCPQAEPRARVSHFVS